MQQIHTIEVWNDKDQFRKQVNDCLKEGYSICSTNCDFNKDNTGTYDTVWQAILLLNDEKGLNENDFMRNFRKNCETMNVAELYKLYGDK